MGPSLTSGFQFNWTVAWIEAVIRVRAGSFYWRICLGCSGQNDRRALRAEFHGEPRNETLTSRSSTLDAIDSVAPMLAIGCSGGVQDDIVVTGASQ